MSFLRIFQLKINIHSHSSERPIFFQVKFESNINYFFNSENWIIHPKKHLKRTATSSISPRIPDKDFKMSAGANKGSSSRASGSNVQSSSSGDIDLSKVGTDFEHPEFLSNIQYIIQLLNTSKDVGAIILSIANTFAMLGIKNADYYAAKVLIRHNSGGLTLVDQFKSIFIPTTKVKPVEIMYSSESFNLHDFYSKHHEIRELDEQDIKYILHQGKAHKEEFRNNTSSSICRILYKKKKPPVHVSTTVLRV